MAGWAVTVERGREVPGRMFLRSAEVAGGARFAVTDRWGGVSKPPYDGLNLGGGVGDAPAAVEENRRRVAAQAALARDRLVFMRQVHGTRVVVVDGPTAAAPAASPEADALVTARRGLGLVVLVADCTPVLLASESPPLVAVAHAGRRGMAAGVVRRTLETMRELGADPGGLTALVGPAICGRCYEVPAELREEVAAAEPAARATTRIGTPALDVPAGVVAQLRAAGVETVRVEPVCTAESDDLYSYRRDGVTGRFAGLAWLPD